MLFEKDSDLMRFILLGIDNYTVSPKPTSLSLCKSVFGTIEMQRSAEKMS